MGSLSLGRLTLVSAPETGNAPDATDLSILKILQEDGHLNNSDLDTPGTLVSVALPERPPFVMM